MTKIQWTDQTWNPVTGCDRISPGCDRCYALTLAGRLKLMGSAAYQTDGDPRTSGPGFAVTLHPDRLDEPLRWRKPRRVFVNSMSDLFHQDVPDWFIFNAWKVMSEATDHTFQVLTKRPQRMAHWYQKLDDRGEGPPTMLGTADERNAVLASGRGSMHEQMVDSWGEPPPGAARPFYDWQGGPRWWPTDPFNVWLGTSVESQRYADLRIPHLLATPAAVRFLSCEPLLDRVSLLPWIGFPRLRNDGSGWEHFTAPSPIDWVIIGGESGPGARPMDLDWTRHLIEQCHAVGVAVFVKQLGSAWGRTHHDIDTWPRHLRIREWPR
jgi:protein gp37